VGRKTTRAVIEATSKRPHAAALAERLSNQESFVTELVKIRAERVLVEMQSARRYHQYRALAESFFVDSGVRFDEAEGCC
jgi:hypothetical protein